jgi:glycosyltransferase involved in cell wall biosynthesis
MYNRKSNESPSVGVVIRTFNSEQYIIESIKSVVTQNYSPLKIVVVDGGSSDKTLEIIKTNFPQIKIINQLNKGLGGAAQDGINSLNTELIAFQDSDDIWTQYRLSIMVQELIKNKEVAAVLCSVEHFLSDELDEKENQNLLVHEGRQPGFGLPALLIYNWVFTEIGSFAEGYSYGEYIDFIDRFRRKGLKINQLELVGLKRRVHNKNYTQKNDINPKMLKTLQMVINRRRNNLDT